MIHSKLTKSLLGLMIAFQSAPGWAKNVNVSALKEVLQNYGVQGEARLNPRAFNDDGRGGLPTFLSVLSQ